MSGRERSDFVQTEAVFLEWPWEQSETCHHENAKLPQPGDPAFLDGKETARFTGHDVKVWDGRVHARDASYEKEGFRLVEQRSAVADFYDEDEVRRVHYPEVAQLIAQETGASEVMVMSHTTRTTRPDMQPARLPGTFMHNDYSKAGALAVRSEFLGETESARRSKQRFAIYHVWRAISGPLESYPLMLGDGSSFDRTDLLIACQHTTPDRVDDYVVVRHAPAQRWFYWPGMQPDEALVFKCWDSDIGQTQMCAHGAMNDPAASRSALPRESIEVRAIAFFEDG